MQVKIKGGDKLEKYLTELARKIGGPAKLQVGFLEGATYPDGTSVAMVAAIQNFGAPKRGIPPRPFFSNMVADKSPHWPESLGAILKDQDFNGAAALELMGHGIKGELQQEIVDTNAPALSPKTVAQKGSAKPLIETGHMLNSVDFIVKKS